MIAEIETHLDKVLQEYTQGPHFESLIEAKNEYFSQTGVITEEDQEYESRMNCFNDWYIFQYLSRRKTKTVIKDYLEKNQVSDDIAKCFLSVNHSLFEFSRVNFWKEIVLRDILHDKKVVLAKDNTHIGLVKNDVFIGRVINYKEKNYLLKGVCIFPTEVKGILAKQSKKVRKMKDPTMEIDFLLKLEALKTKSLRYGHIDHTKIFVFT